MKPLSILLQQWKYHHLHKCLILVNISGRFWYGAGVNPRPNIYRFERNSDQRLYRQFRFICSYKYDWAWLSCLDWSWNILIFCSFNGAGKKKNKIGVDLCESHTEIFYSAQCTEHVVCSSPYLMALLSNRVALSKGIKWTVCKLFPWLPIAPLNPNMLFPYCLQIKLHI